MEQESLTQRGIRLAKEGKMHEARQVFLQVIDEDPDNASAWCNYGTTFLHEERYAEALPYYKRAILLDPLYNGPYLSTGMCLTALGFFEDAIRLYDLALNAIPDDHEIWYNKAYTLMEIGRIPEAIAGYDHVLKIHPLDAGAYINRRELLKSCTFKRQCVTYVCEQGQMILQTSFVYEYDGIWFMTPAMDDLDEKDLVEYDPDETQEYEKKESDDFSDLIKKKDPRYWTQTLVYFTPEGVLAHGRLQHSPGFPGWAESSNVDGHMVFCPRNICAEVICRSNRRYILCISVDLVYAHEPDTLMTYDVFKEGNQWFNPEYEDGWDEGDREDCRRAWQWYSHDRFYGS